MFVQFIGSPPENKKCAAKATHKKHMASICYHTKTLYHHIRTPKGEACIFVKKQKEPSDIMIIRFLCGTLIITQRK